MAYVLYCLDKTGNAPLRQKIRPAHLEYMIAEIDKVLFGGPLQTQTGDVIGSLMVLNVAERADVEQFLEHEPYAKGGLFGEIRINKFKQMAPENPPGLLQSELEKELRRREATTG